jgi:hypothetical protein
VIAEGGSASLAAILEREFSGFSRQVRFGGCDIVVNPSAAVYDGTVWAGTSQNLSTARTIAAPITRAGHPIRNQI